MGTVWFPGQTGDVSVRSKTTKAFAEAYSPTLHKGILRQACGRAVARIGRRRDDKKRRFWTGTSSFPCAKPKERRACDRPWVDGGRSGVN